MAAKNPQTHAKRAREAALRERRELKAAKKAERRAAGGLSQEPDVDADVTVDEEAAPELDAGE